MSEIVREVVPTTRGMLASSTELDVGHDRTRTLHIEGGSGGSEVLPWSCHCVKERLIDERWVRLCCVF